MANDESMGLRAWRWLRLMLLRCLLAAGSVLVALVGLELGLRLFWDGYYLKVSEPYAMPHATRGWCNLPDAVVIDGEPEFLVTATHDSFGHRGVPVGRERTPGRARVLVLGDSFTYGLGVEDDETYCARLQAEVPALEVVNAGVNGYGTGQQLLLLREDGLLFEPDIVIVGFFSNDLSDNVVGPTRASFVLEDGALRELSSPEAVLASAPANRSDRRGWLRSSYAYRFLSDRGKQLRAARAKADAPAGALTGERRESAWQLALALLREIHRTAREGGARMVLLVIPEQVQVQHDGRWPGYDENDHDVLDRLHPFAEAENIPLVDPLPALHQAYAVSAEPLYYREDRHMRPEGHAIVARVLADALRELGWLDE